MALMPGSDVLVGIVDFEDEDSTLEVTAVVLEDLGSDVMVRLTGFLPEPYRVGDVLGLPARKVRMPSTEVVVRHADGLASFPAPVRSVPACEDTRDHWVVCEEFEVGPMSLTRALDSLREIEQLNACYWNHRIVRRWTPRRPRSTGRGRQPDPHTTRGASMAFNLLAAISEDRAAAAAAFLLGVPVAELETTTTAGMATLAAAQGYMRWGDFHPYDPQHAAARVRLQVDTVAGYLAQDSMLGPAFFPLAGEEDADEVAVPFAETLVRAACMYTGAEYRTRDGRKRLRAFRAVVTAAVRFGFEDEEG